MDWAAAHYMLSHKDKRYPVEVRREIEKDFYKYGGQRPLCVENPHWQKAKARLREDLGGEKTTPQKSEKEDEKPASVEEKKTSKEGKKKAKKDKNKDKDKDKSKEEDKDKDKANDGTPEKSPQKSNVKVKKSATKKKRQDTG